MTRATAPAVEGCDARKQELRWRRSLWALLDSDAQSWAAGELDTDEFAENLRELLAKIEARGRAMTAVEGDKREMKCAWTKGPWNWMAVHANASGGFHLYLIDSAKRKLAALWGRADEKRANANLIASAPELYEALYRLSNECIIDGLEQRAGFDCWIHLARAALARARGEQP